LRSKLLTQIENFVGIHRRFLTKICYLFNHTPAGRVTNSNMVDETNRNIQRNNASDPPQNIGGDITNTEECVSEVTKEGEDKGTLLSLFHSTDTMGCQQGGALGQLKQCIKTEVFGKLKFLPHEGKSLPDQARLKLTFPSFDLPDLTKKKELLIQS